MKIKSEFIKYYDKSKKYLYCFSFCNMFYATLIKKDGHVYYHKNKDMAIRVCQCKEEKLKCRLETLFMNETDCEVICDKMRDLQDELHCTDYHNGIF